MLIFLSLKTLKLMKNTIKISENTLIIGVYEWGKLEYFTLPHPHRTYPREYAEDILGVNIPKKEEVLRVSQAKKLGFKGFV